MYIVHNIVVLFWRFAVFAIQILHNIIYYGHNMVIVLLVLMTLVVTLTRENIM